MPLREILNQCWRNLHAHRLRSFLTMFGIAWGIFSIMVLIAAGAGLQQGYEKMNQTLGRDLLLLFPGQTSLQAGGLRAGHKVTFRNGDVEKIRAECPDVRWMSPELMRNVSANSRFNSGSFDASGAYAGYGYYRDETIATGRFYDAGDVLQARRVAVLGFNVAQQLFHGNPAAGETITLNHIPYLVIGTLTKKDQNSDYNGPDNDHVFLPFTAMLRDFPEQPPSPPDAVDMLLVVPRSASLHLRADAEVRRGLAALHHFDPLDKEAVFSWDTVLDSEMFGKMTSAMQQFLGATGLLTLALGALGVMNIMFVAATERTREIGIHKAMGATCRSIRRQFLLESLILTFTAGFSGMLIGFGLCALINRLPMPAFFAGLIVSPQVACGAALALAVLGILAGWMPARSASKIDPIQALQYEH